MLEGMATTSSINAPPAAEWDAVQEGTALFDRSERGKLALSGPDSAEFLDSLLSNEIRSLEPGSGCAATLLTPKGRILAEVRIVRTEQELWLDTDRNSLQALYDALRTFRIGYRSELHKRTLEQALISLIGPGSADAIGFAVPDAEHASAAGEVAGSAVLAIRSDVGIDVVADAAVTAEVIAALERAGARQVGEDAVECLRIERGRPRFGIDIDETTMPQEAGIHERTVSYSKGCYVGQEVVARLYWKGRPNRHLRGVLLSAPAEPGTPLHRGDALVGTLGSVAISPERGPIALALVRREAVPGESLSLGDSSASGQLVVLPF
jgi:folate-binding protein YgfZ